ncbi:Uncharacterised protein [Mycobacteroides abscessus subsp. abscessus]|uniref:hypothetical protein n=1 Tax=Mycobacteroides abscessus TaxID=36809 RepID=UPI000928187E|nr:hypothetical protein [Mycobacteroides abscessus]SIH37437.1 Uncharacterised protein [Mycobacteroides abscessus subsp. abscessus]
MSSDMPEGGRFRGESAPDRYHHYWGGKDACDKLIAGMRTLGIDVGCFHSGQPAGLLGDSSRSGVQVVIKGEDATGLAQSFSSPLGNWFHQELESANGFQMSFDTEMWEEWEQPNGYAYAAVSDERYFFAGDLPRSVAVQIAEVLTGKRHLPVPVLLGCFDNDLDEYITRPDGEIGVFPVYLVPEFVLPEVSPARLPALPVRTPANLKRRTTPTRAQRKKHTATRRGIR